MQRGVVPQASGFPKWAATGLRACALYAAACIIQPARRCRAAGQCARRHSSSRPQLRRAATCTAAASRHRLLLGGARRRAVLLQQRMRLVVAARLRRLCLR